MHLILVDIKMITLFSFPLLFLKSKISKFFQTFCLERWWKFAQRKTLSGLSIFLFKLSFGKQIWNFYYKLLLGHVKNYFQVDLKSEAWRRSKYTIMKIQNFLDPLLKMFDIGQVSLFNTLQKDNCSLYH
jgi:hypothetical protein